MHSNRTFIMELGEEEAISCLYLSEVYQKIEHRDDSVLIHTIDKNNVVRFVKPRDKHLIGYTTTV